MSVSNAIRALCPHYICMHYIFLRFHVRDWYARLVENACSYVEPLEAVDLSAVGTGPRSSVGRPVTSIFATGCDIHTFAHARMCTHGTYPHTIPTCTYATAYTSCKLRSNSPIAPSTATELSRRHGIVRSTRERRATRNFPL